MKFLQTMLITLSLFGFGSQAKSQIATGAVVPDFSLQDQDGHTFTLSSALAKGPVVVYFYPKDDSPGCTKEACSFRDSFAAFQDAGVQVVGISSDDVASHKSFAEKYHLPFTLLSDTKGEVRKLFGVEGKKIAICGDIMHSRVALSNIYCLKKLGAEVTVVGPPTLIPKHIGEALGVNVSYNIREALEWADVANVLRIQLERQNMPLFSSLREYSLAYGVNRKLLDSLKKDIVIMHPGPINRGVELSSDVADSGQSIILDQVENGVATRMAVLYLLGRNES